MPRMRCKRIESKLLTNNRKDMNKYIKPFTVLIVGIAIGNRVFNHLHAWLGVAIITATIIFFIYKLTKIIKNEKVD